MAKTQASLLDLPNELLISTLANLTLKDLLVCRQLCQRLNRLHDECRLQYLAELETAGMIDNPYCRMGTAEKLEKLRKRETAWAALSHGMEASVPIPKTPSGVYDVTPTTYLLGVAAAPHMPITLGIQSLKLPSGFDNSPPSYSEIQIPKQIVDFGTSIEEHDLLAVVAISATSDYRFFLELTLLRHSTGALHDKAGMPVITVMEIFNMASISIEISGENLALSVWAESDMTSLGTLHLFNWQKGSRKGPMLPVGNLGLVFLREDLLLVPNIPDLTFNVNYIPYSTPGVHDSRLTMQPILSLSLPTINSGHRMLGLQMRCDPSPTGGNLYPKYGPEERPFANDPKEAIMISEMRIRDLSDGKVKTCLMFVQRKALLNLLPVDWESKIVAIVPNMEPLATTVSTADPSTSNDDVVLGDFGEQDGAEGDETDSEEEAEEPAMPGSFNADEIVEAQGNEDTLDGDEMGLLMAIDEAQAQSISNTTPEPTPPDHGDSEEAEKPPSQGTPQLAWADWGPENTRWVDGDKFNSLYITSTAGQRFVSIEGEARTEPSVIKVLDFNRYHVRKAESGDPQTLTSSVEKVVGGEKGKEVEMEGKEVEVDDSEECPAKGAFEGEIVSKLPYIQLSTKVKYNYDAVLLDEQRILGIRYAEADEPNVIKEVDTLHFG